MRHLPTLLTLAVLLSACGGGGSDTASGESRAAEEKASAAALLMTEAPADDGAGDAGSADSSDGTEPEGGATPGPVPAVGAGTVPAVTFGDVCLGGRAHESATPYTQTAGVHPFAPYVDAGEGFEFVAMNGDFPDGWSGSSFDAELALCLTVTEAVPATPCEFEDRDTGETLTLETFDAAYDVALYVAQTGELLLETSTELVPYGDCPFIASFVEGESTAVDHASPGPVLTEQLNAIVNLV